MSCLSPSLLLCNADVLVAATVCVPTLLQPNKPKKPKRPWEKELWMCLMNLARRQRTHW
jgi:hypothetical protein